MLRKVRKLELRVKRGGGSIEEKGQRYLVDGLFVEKDEWMYRLCSARLLRGDYSDWSGWECRNEWAMATRQPSPNKRWGGPRDEVKTLAIYGEQGIGDEIMFASCIPEVQDLGIEVTIECDKRLESIFQRSFGCKTRPRDRRGENNLPLSLKRPEDAFIPLGDIPPLFRKSRASFVSRSFLKPDPLMVEKWSHLKGLTGIAWRGRRGKFKPEEFGLNNPVCLQYDSWEAETQGMIVPEVDLHNDFEDLLGISANLEKVVTVPQTIVHFAGSQGIAVEVVIPPVFSGRVLDQINYRYGLGGRMDWYHSVETFPNLNAWRQKR